MGDEWTERTDLQSLRWYAGRDLSPQDSRRGKESPPVECDKEGGLEVRRRYTEEQIFGVLRESEAGAKMGELCRRYGISRTTFCEWRSKYVGLILNEQKSM